MDQCVEREALSIEPTAKTIETIETCVATVPNQAFPPGWKPSLEHPQGLMGTATTALLPRKLTRPDNSMDKQMLVPALQEQHLAY
jgi:hypothetical protein